MVSYIYWLIYNLYSTIFCLLVISSFFGSQLGLKRIYVNFLSKLFEFGSRKIERKEESRRVLGLYQGSSTDDVSTTPTEEYLGMPNLRPNCPPSIKYSKLQTFHLQDILVYITAGVAGIMEDTFMPYFEPETLPCWNLLSRTNTRDYEFISFRLTFYWLIGFIIRYFILLPLRLVILLSGMVLMLFHVSLISILPCGNVRNWINARLSKSCFTLVAGSLSLCATFHNTENRPRFGVAVANHTSPIDSVVLATDNLYDMIGQKHNGLMGFFQRSLSYCSDHIWFDRADAADRASVTKRMKVHTSDTDLPPLLIFPEGVCVNNTSVVQFKKGAFELDTTVFPIAIRFDARFGDAFWWQDNFFYYILYMMTSWAIVCDVWYLPPMCRNPEEGAISFASRVKRNIARQGGLIDLSWDGFLKATPVKADYKKIHQNEFAKHLKPSLSDNELNESQEPLNEVNKSQELSKEPLNKSQIPGNRENSKF